LDFQKNTALLVAFTAIFSGLLGPVLSFDFAFATSEEEEGDNGDDGEEVEMNLNLTQDLRATQDQNHQ
jgi:hypothetical protein